MILTVLFTAVLAVIALGLTRPIDPRRIGIAAALGVVVGLLATYFNIYPGSIRGALGLITAALFVSGMRFGGRYLEEAPPLLPRAPWIAAVIAVFLLGAGLFPYTEAGADSVDEPVYQSLRANVETGPAPPLPNAREVRVVPWDTASQLAVRAYGSDASWLDTSPRLLLTNTWPDTVGDDFIWVHTPVPETAKWVFGDRRADKVVYIRNEPNNITPAVVEGELKVHVDGLFWQDRVQRNALRHSEFRYVLQDAVLQLDDAYVPHWIGYLSRVDIRDQPHLEKLLVVNAYTGDENVYDPADAPEWIEQVYPESYVYYWAKYWGEHREGVVYRWFNAAGLVEPDDVTVRYIRLEDQTYWLLPMKQLDSPQLGGYILINTRTGAATYYDRSTLSYADYDTALQQVLALMRSGEATSGAGRIDLTVSEGYLYPIKMSDNTIRDAYIFPLLENLKISRFAIVDAQYYTNRSVFSSSIGDALSRFANQTVSSAPINIEVPTALPVLDGSVSEGKIIVNLNGTLFRVTVADLEEGDRREGQREFDELELAVTRANRGDSVTLQILIRDSRVIDVRYPGVSWG